MNPILGPDSRPASSSTALARMTPDQFKDWLLARIEDRLEAFGERKEKVRARQKDAIARYVDKEVARHRECYNSLASHPKPAPIPTAPAPRILGPDGNPSPLTRPPPPPHNRTE